MRSALRLSLMATLASLAFSPAVFAEEAAPAAQSKAAESKEDYMMLQVNGEPITRARVLEIWTALFPEGKAPDFDSFDEKVRQNVLRGIVSEQLVYKEAQKSGLSDDPAIAEELAKLKEKLVTQKFLEQKATAQVSEADIRKVYDQKAAELKGKEEVQARHILVDSEDKAEEMIEELEDGADFAELAKKESLDKASAVKGGDLGWFTEERMVPEFSKAAFKLKAGEISKPVKTDFGWHVVKVEKRRPVEVPVYDEVKDVIADELKARALKGYITGLVDSASIKYFSPDGKELEFSKAPDSTAEKKDGE